MSDKDARIVYPAAPEQGSAAAEAREVASGQDRRRQSRFVAIRNPWWLRLVVVAMIATAVSVIWITNSLLGDRFSETTRNRAEVRLALYTGHVLSELQRTSVVPLLLARDPALIASLNASDYSITSQRLISAQTEIGAASILLLDQSGRVVAATDRTQIGSLHGNDGYFVNAQRSQEYRL